MATERELKFSLVDDFPEAEDLEVIFAEAGLELLPQPTLKQFDAYYDDEKKTLGKAGLALRRRRVAGQSIATLKAQTTIQGALHSREEVEEPMLGSSWPEPIFERIKNLTDPWSLQEKLELSTLRQRYLIRQQKDLATLSFDQVSANYPKSTSSIYFEELEIEAIHASNQELQDIADMLDKHIKLSANSVNKLERAEALLSLTGAFEDDAT